MALINQTIFILVSCLAAFSGFWVLLSNRKNIVNRAFFAVSLMIFFWIVFGYLGLNYPEHSLLFLRLNFSAVCLFFLSTYIFSLHFPNSSPSPKGLNILVAVISIFGAAASIFSNLLISSSQVDNGRITYTMGFFKNPFYILVILLTLLILKNLILGYLKQNKENKRKIFYFFIGVALYAFLNIVFNVLLPLFKINPSQFSNYGDYSAVFFLAFTAYAVLKHQLFDIRVITTEAIVVILSLSLFVEIFVSNSFAEGLIKGLIWLAATYGGWQLIKSVTLEIKQKEELQYLAKKLEGANAHLKDLDHMKDDFLSMASHELNTPLASIEGYLSMMLEEGMGGDLQPKTREYLDRVFSSAKRLAEIVKGLLNVSRIESGRIHLIYEDVQIEDIIKQSVAEIDPKVKEKNHKICMELPAKPVTKSWMDLTRITEVVINLLGNAIKYTDEGGHIEVGAKQEKNNLLVWVKDNGRGIPKDKADRVFQKFSQVDVLKDEVKGTGLGMFISQKFVELHKGKIWFDSDGDGCGTTFFFSLPILATKPFDPHEGDGPVLR